MKILIFCLTLLSGCTFNVQIDHELSSQSGSERLTGNEKHSINAKSKSNI